MVPFKLYNDDFRLGLPNESMIPTYFCSSLTDGNDDGNPDGRDGDHGHGGGGLGGLGGLLVGVDGAQAGLKVVVVVVVAVVVRVHHDVAYLHTQSHTIRRENITHYKVPHSALKV